jgi:hypothetical protein
VGQKGGHVIGLAAGAKLADEIAQRAMGEAELASDVG